MSDVTLDSLLKKKGEEQQAEMELAPDRGADLAEIEDLSPQQLAKVKEIRADIDLTDSNVLMQYGIGAQRDIQTFSESILEKVKMKDSGKAGELLSDLSDEVNSMKVDELVGGKLPLFGSLAKSLRKFARRYETVEVAVDRISNELEKERMDMVRDVTMFDTMYQKNLDHFRDLQVYIRAGEEEIEDIRAASEDLRCGYCRCRQCFPHGWH